VSQLLGGLLVCLDALIDLDQALGDPGFGCARTRSAIRSVRTRRLVRRSGTLVARKLADGLGSFHELLGLSEAANDCPAGPVPVLRALFRFKGGFAPAYGYEKASRARVYYSI
jgi:hypothetical protein